MTAAPLAALTVARAQYLSGPAPIASAGSPSFGLLDKLSPLIVMFNAPDAARGGAPGLSLLSEPGFDLISAFNGAAEESQAPSAPLAPTLSPLPTAIEGAVERLLARADRPNPLGRGDWRAARAAIGGFYADHKYAPVWVSANGLTKAARAVLSQLERAGEDGLDLSNFALPQDVQSGSSFNELAEIEITIAAAVVVYAEQATGSRVTPARISPLITTTPSVADPRAALAETAAAANPGALLGDFNPPQKGYRELREALERLTDALPNGRRPRARAGAGATSIPVQVARMRAEHPAFASADPQLDILTRPESWPGQRRAAPASLARQRAAILANMEMWRWEPRDMGERRIEINVADYSASLLEGDSSIHQTRVIVGKPDTPTPIFSNVMRYVVLNPSWQVPDSIIKKEMMPKLAYLSRHGYEVKTVGGRLAVRQLPGDDNALGRIAFMFPNEHSVYLHDTPARELFDQETRAFSHGCIRVEDPMSLAELVLGGESNGWTAERLDAAVGGPERTVFLPRPVPIHIEYFTEFVDDFGELQERADVYGITRKVEGTIAAASQD
jgi:murein L,D-transpeptidase YcbB/YkuD